MTSRYWKIDPQFTRPEHKLAFHSAYKQDFGATVKFKCENEGCGYYVSLPVNMPEISLGVCFDQNHGQIVDDE